MEQPHHTQLYLVLKINNELVLRLADVEDEKTAPEIQRLFEEFLTAAIVDNAFLHSELTKQWYDASAKDNITQGAG